MADSAEIIEVDKPVRRLTSTSESSSQLPPRIVVPRQRPLATAIPSPSHIEGQSQILCPKCGNWWEHGGLLSGIEFAAAEVKEGDSDSFCNLCEQKLTAKRLLQQSPTSKDSASEMQFIRKIDKAAGTQVTAHVTRRYHQTRRKCQGNPVKVFRSMKRDVQFPRTARLSQHTPLKIVLGSGRFDPFLSLSMPNVPRRYHELVDYCVTVLWPGLRGFDYSIAYAREWLPIASQNPSVLNVFLFTASLHLETLRGPGSLAEKKIRAEQLYHKGEAIRGIYETLHDPKYCLSDELIQSVLFLAMNETGEEEDLADPSPFTGPLQNVQWLSVYGTRIYATSHVNAVQEIIKRRGGIRNIKAVGLPWLISFSELIYCAATLSKPQHPLLDPFGRDIVYQSLGTSYDASNERVTSERSTQGFHFLHESGVVIEIFLNLKDYSEAVAAYGNGASLPGCMVDNRNWVLHRLLSLPCAGATGVFSQLDLLSQDFHRGKLCLEVCHLTAIMYCIHATFPVPRSMCGRQLLQLQMKESISKIHLTTGEQALGELCCGVSSLAA